MVSLALHRHLCCQHPSLVSHSRALNGYFGADHHCDGHIHAYASRQWQTGFQVWQLCRSRRCDGRIRPDSGGVTLVNATLRSLDANSPDAGLHRGRRRSGCGRTRSTAAAHATTIRADNAFQHSASCRAVVAAAHRYGYAFTRHWSGRRDGSFLCRHGRWSGEPWRGRQGFPRQD